MIDEIKQVVQNYLNNAKLSNFTVGVVVDGGIQVSEKLIIPNELISGNLKTSIIPGNRVRLLRNHGGQEFFILEVITDVT